MRTLAMRTLAIRRLAFRLLAGSRLAGLLVSASLVTTALAQPNPADFNLPAVEPDPLYHVEMILFAFDEGNRFEEDLLHDIENPGFAPPLKLLRVPTIELETVFGLPAETPAADDPASAATTPLPDQEIAGADNSGDTIPAIDPLRDRLELIERPGTENRDAFANTVALPAGFRPLTSGELELNNVAARMNRRPYTLLGHAGWVQTGVDTDRSVELDLKFLGIDNPTGTIEVSARRYLHAVVDFVFHDGAGTFWSAASDFGVAPLQYAQSFAIEDEINAIRSGDSLYLVDHPLYGVLIQIRRAPEPEDETGSESAGGPAG